MSFDPYTYDNMDVPEDFNPPVSENMSQEQWVIVALKCARAEIECMFEHFKLAMAEDDQASQTTQEELYRMMRHLSNVVEALHSMGATIHAGLAPDTVKQLIKEKAEERHGVEFDVVDVMTPDGETMGVVLKPKDPSLEIDDITTWLSNEQPS